MNPYANCWSRMYETRPAEAAEPADGLGACACEKQIDEAGLATYRVPGRDLDKEAKGGIEGVPEGFGASADQIAAALQNARDAAAAHQYVTDDYSDAIGYCQAAASASLTAERTLNSSPSMSDIGAQTAIIQKIISDGRTNSGAYGDAYQAASSAYQDFLKDSLLPANQTSPTPPNPAPNPPNPNPSPSPSPTPPTGPTDTSSTSYATPILVTAGLAAAGILGYAAYKRYYGKPASGSRARTRVPSGRTVHSARTVRA